MSDQSSTENGTGASDVPRIETLGHEIRTPEGAWREAMSDSVSNGYVSAHDPLCTWRQAEEADAEDPYRWLAGGLSVCDCDKIRQVRAEESNRVMTMRYTQVKGWQEMKEAIAYQQGMEDMLAKCIAALPHAHDCWANDPDTPELCACMAAITRDELCALQENP